MLDPFDINHQSSQFIYRGERIQTNASYPFKRISSNLFEVYLSIFTKYLCRFSHIISSFISLSLYRGGIRIAIQRLQVENRFSTTRRVKNLGRHKRHDTIRANVDRPKNLWMNRHGSIRKFVRLFNVKNATPEINISNFKKVNFKNFLPLFLLHPRATLEVYAIHAASERLFLFPRVFFPSLRFLLLPRFPSSSFLLQPC